MAEQYNIRWNNYTSVLQSVLKKLLLDQQFVDVTLACEGGSIKCHRVVLTACSIYFEKILREYPESSLVIFLKDTKIWELQALVTFMYNGEVSVNQTKLAGLVKAAEALKIKGLAPENSDEIEDGDKESEEEFDLKAMVGGGRKVGSPKKEESLLRITKTSVQPPPSAPPPLIQIPGNSSNPALKRRMPTLQKLVKVQKIEHPVKLQYQSNGQTPPAVDAQASVPRVFEKVKREMDDDDSLIHQYERAEVEQMYGNLGDDSDADDYKDVEDDMELVDGLEEDVDGSNEGQSTGSDIEEPVPGMPPGAERKLRFKYSKDVKDSALAALNSGVSIKQCSEAFNIPRKTLSKWKSRDLRDLRDAVADETGEFDDGIARRTGIEHGDRAERLQKAMELALSGTTVRQAAAHFDIPRTTLCAYMKRRGVAPKRNFLTATTGSGLPIPRRSNEFAGGSPLGIECGYNVVNVEDVIEND